MAKKKLLAFMAALAGAGLSCDAIAIAPTGHGGGTQSAPSSQGGEATPDVPGSGPASPIDQAAPNVPGEVGAPASSAGGSSGGPSSAIDETLVDRVRSAIADDPSLSAFNQKVDVALRQGKVRLSGSVGTQQERGLIEAKAAQIVGAANVDNRLSISSQPR